MSRNNKEIQPYWRPDFRVQSTLPDIKVIRTDFIINSIAVLLVLFCGIFVLQREFRAFTLGKSISAMEQTILVAEPDDIASLKVSERFREAARHIEELQKFYSYPLSMHEFLAELSMQKPKDLIFNQITISESVAKVKGKSQVEHRIEINGDVGELTTLTDFKEILQGLDLLSPEGILSEVDESIQQRNAKTGSFPYRISITLKPELVTATAAGKENGGAG